MTTTTLCLTKALKTPMVTETEFESGGNQQSITIYAGDASITLIADADTAPAFFGALHQATGRIVDRLTVAALRKNEFRELVVAVNEGTRRIDANGRDVTDLPGLWSATDKFVGVDAATEPDRQVETTIEPALPEELF